MNMLLGGIGPMLIILVFIGGYAWAGKFCKNKVAQFFVGILLSFGIFFTLIAVAFAGCLLVIGGMNHMH